jgi:hypothetical protein
MGWSQTGRILLVWPDQGSVLNRRLDLALIQRHSSRLGAQLALVSSDHEVVYQAGKLGIPIYRSIPHAQKSHWRVEHRHRQSTPVLRQESRPRPDLENLRREARPQPPEYLNHPGVRLGLFTLGVVALLAIVAVLTPSAEIVLTPAAEPQEAILTVRASPSIEENSISGSVPARWVKVTVEGRDSIPTSGTMSVPQEYASGFVVFKNLTEQEIEIPQGLVVRSLDETPIRFEVIRKGLVPAGVDQLVSLPVRALEPGAAGNLPTGALVGIEGSLGANLSATNTRPTRGGTGQNLPVPTQEDRENLFGSLEVSLRTTALEEFKAQLDPGDILFTDTITVSQMVEQSYDPDRDMPGGQLSLNLRMEYQALITSAADLQQLGETVLDAALAEGYQPVEGSLEVVHKETPLMDSDFSARWKMAVKRQVESGIVPYDAINQVLGLPPGLAASQLEAALPLDSPPEIRLFPSWWPRMPVLPFRVQVTPIG